MIGVLVVLTSKLRMLLKSVIIMKNLELGSLFFNSDLQSRLFRDFNLFVFVLSVRKETDLLSEDPVSCMYIDLKC